MKILVSLLLSTLILVQLDAQKAIEAYIFMAEDCPVCNYILQDLKTISEEYADEVKFIAVFPQKRSNYKSAVKFIRDNDLNVFEIELDPNHIITDRLNATVTPEVIVKRVEGPVLYQGRVNDAYIVPGRRRHGRVKQELKEALAKIKTGIQVSHPWPKPVGCYITKR